MVAAPRVEGELLKLVFTAGSRTRGEERRPAAGRASGDCRGYARSNTAYGQPSTPRIRAAAFSSKAASLAVMALPIRAFTDTPGCNEPNPPPLLRPRGRPSGR